MGMMVIPGSKFIFQIDSVWVNGALVHTGLEGGQGERVLLLLRDHWGWWKILGLAVERVRNAGPMAKGSRMCRDGSGDCGLTI